MEIRSKIARLKSEGRMKNKDGTKNSSEDSAMQEAEAFFNKPSPFKKFEERVENERLALLKEEAENKSKLQDDEGLVK